MITLQEIFDDLAHGELSNVAMGNSALGTIKEADYPQVVSGINLGLDDLYKRFNLKQSTVRLHQHADISTYYLRSDYSAPLDEMGEDYYLEEIDDETFADDVVKLIGVKNEDGEKVTINDSSDDTGITTRSFDVLEMTPRSPTEIFTITYQAKYPKIIIEEDFDPTEEELHIHSGIEVALLNYVASRVFKGKTSKAAEGEQSISTTFMMAYENECAKIKMYGLPMSNNDTNEKFLDRGFV